MTSNKLKQQKEPIVFELKREPKTPHEEIMFCINSTNDIVSEILEQLENPEKVICRYKAPCYWRGKE